MKILSILADRECTISMLASTLKTTAANLSHHIRRLLGARLVVLVETRPTARNVEKYYRASARSYSVDYDSESSSDAPLDVHSSFRADIESAFMRRDAVAHGGSADSAAVGGSPSFASLLSARISPEKAAEFRERLIRLAREFSDTSDQDGVAYSLALALLQGS